MKILSFIKYLAAYTSITVASMTISYSYGVYKAGKTPPQVTKIETIKPTPPKEPKVFYYVHPDDLHCLATAMYYEARDQSKKGQLAVAMVILNRVHTKGFPNTICGVVRAGVYTKNGHIVLNHCAFSYNCDGLPEKPKNLEVWRQIKAYAWDIIHNQFYVKDPTKGALWYHAEWVRPEWAKEYKKTVKIGEHIFYARRDS